MAVIITRETGGTAKGSPLTNAELDANFINLNADIQLRQLASARGVANGYASLDSSGKVPAAQLTAIDGVADMYDAYPSLKVVSAGTSAIVRNAAPSQYRALRLEFVELKWTTIGSLKLEFIDTGANPIAITQMEIAEFAADATTIAMQSYGSNIFPGSNGGGGYRTSLTIELQLGYNILPSARYFYTNGYSGTTRSGIIGGHTLQAASVSGIKLSLTNSATFDSGYIGVFGFKA